MRVAENIEICIEPIQVRHRRDYRKPNHKSMVRKSGHAGTFISLPDINGDRWVIKGVKSGKKVSVVMEASLTQVARCLIGPRFVPEIRLLRTDNQLAGLAVKAAKNFVDFIDINLIRLFADIERNDTRYLDSVARELASVRAAGDEEDIVACQKRLAKINELSLYFRDKSKRLEVFSQYIFIIFLRSLTYEDDGHKGNVAFDTGLKQMLAIDFDLLMYINICVYFGFVRMSQWGSPFKKFNYTIDDLKKFPFSGSNAGFDPSEKTSIFNGVITNNPGAYTGADVEALRYLCSLDDYKIAKWEAINLSLKRFFEVKPSEIEDSLRAIRPLALDDLELHGDSAYNFAKIAACEFAKLQVRIFKLFHSEYKDKVVFNGSEQKLEQPIDVEYSEKVFLDNYISYDDLYLDYLCEKNNNKFDRLFYKYCGILSSKDEQYPLAVRLQYALEEIDLDYHLQSDELAVKNLMLRLCVVAAGSCQTAKDIKELVDWWQHLSQNFIVKTREAGYFARTFKNHFYNKWTSTYVSIRDVFLKRALLMEERDSELDLSNEIARLKKATGWIASHSQRQLSFKHRLNIHLRRVYTHSYKRIGGSFYDYFSYKQGMDKYFLSYLPVISHFLIFIRDAFINSTLEVTPFIFEQACRYPRRFFADFYRSNLKGKSCAWFMPKLLIGVLYGLFTTLQWTFKAIRMCAHAIVSPFKSIERTSLWAKPEKKNPSTVEVLSSHPVAAISGTG